MLRIYGRLSNLSAAQIQLVEILFLTPPGSCGCVLDLPPRRRSLVRASEFTERNRVSGRPSIISVYVDGAKAPQFLTPDDFRRFIEISFRVDGYGRLTIRGVEARFSDHFQIWGWRCFGRSHVGRPELTIT